MSGFFFLDLVVFYAFIIIWETSYTYFDAREAIFEKCSSWIIDFVGKQWLSPNNYAVRLFMLVISFYLPVDEVFEH